MDYKEYIENINKMMKKGNLETLQLNYVPKEIYQRKEEIERILSNFAHIVKGINQNMALIGNRGIGKTITIKNILSELNLPAKYVNCRGLTHYDIIESILGIEKSGHSPSTLQKEIERMKEKIIVLDELDMSIISKNEYNCLYPLSERFNLIIILNNPQFLENLDMSIISRLQLDKIYFTNYVIEEIKKILDLRIKEGKIEGIEESLLLKISALTFKNCNSDIRMALKTLQYIALNKYENIDLAFKKATEDVFVEVVENESIQNKIILKSMTYQKDNVKDIYLIYSHLCSEFKVQPFSYSYFYRQLAYLQTKGIITLLTSRERGNPKKAEILIKEEILKNLTIL